jgi:hypothetical protein
LQYSDSMTLEQILNKLKNKTKFDLTISFKSEANIDYSRIKNTNNKVVNLNIPLNPLNREFEEKSKDEVLKKTSIYDCL